MGTHPIFESDFDCLTDCKKMAGIGNDAHTMTSLNRPTSRVLAPPGGGSSNIFGTDAPTPIESKAKAAARHQQSSSIFGGQPEKQAAQTPKTQPQRADPIVSSQDGVGTRTVQKPSTKVHAPPGGHSSISFG